MTNQVCAACGQELPEQALFCPGCGEAVTAPAAVEAPAAAARVAGGGMPENVAAALAYVTFIPALVFILRPPWQRNPVVRFHSFQCLLLWGVGLAAAVLLKLLSLLAFLLTALVALILLVGMVILWVVLMLKAYLGQEFELPVIGEAAERLAERT